jgi:hypothetical protein
LIILGPLLGVCGDARLYPMFHSFETPPSACQG